MSSNKLIIVPVWVKTRTLKFLDLHESFVCVLLRFVHVAGLHTVHHRHQVHQHVQVLLWHPDEHIPHIRTTHTCNRGVTAAKTESSSRLCITGRSRHCDTAAFKSSPTHPRAKSANWLAHVCTAQNVSTVTEGPLPLVTASWGNHPSPQKPGYYKMSQQALDLDRSFDVTKKKCKTLLIKPQRREH